MTAALTVLEFAARGLLIVGVWFAVVVVLVAGLRVATGGTTPTPPKPKEGPAPMSTINPPAALVDEVPRAGAALARQGELVERIKARRLSKRELILELAREQWLLEVRTTGASRVVAHNAQLEAELRTVIGADALTIHEADLSPDLVDTLHTLGNKYGPLGTIRTALTILGGRK